MKTLTPELREHYKKLWDSCIVTKKPEYELSIINKNKSIYEKIGLVPWDVIACIHGLEASFNFKAHLHNGDPLTSRTLQVPAGRPTMGNPPFSFEESARDALQMSLPYDDWSIEGKLYFLEQYNGTGYLLYHKDVNSPYIWSGTNNYTKGKYASDGKYDPNLVSKQVGAASILKFLNTETITNTDSTQPHVQILTSNVDSYTSETVSTVNSAWNTLGK